ncbi:MAG: tetratricopeptide repeat protein [Nitrospirae bacterium]|nr:tetratricopeptide repeat protein [Nitrospirota bacterium]
MIVADASYVMGDSDTLAGAEENALLRAKRKAVEEAGVYIEASSTDVETHAGSATLHLNQLSVRTITAAVTETDILEKRRALDGDRPSFYVKIRATVHLDMLAEAVKRLTSDEQLAAHHRQLQTENSQLKTQLESLREQLQASGPRREPASALKTRRAAIDLGQAAIKSHSLPEKIDLASRAIAADDLYPNAYVIRGQTYLRIVSLTFSNGATRGQISPYVERAIADFDRALTLDPSSTWALLGRGDAFTWQKKMREAAGDYERLLRLDPLFDVARQRLIALSTTTAKKQIAAKQWRQALSTLDKVLRADAPQSWVAQEKDAYLLRSQIYTELGELERAASDLTGVIRVDPSNAQALLRRGQLYRRLLQGRQAKDDLEQACGLGLEEACTVLQ